MTGIYSLALLAMTLNIYEEGRSESVSGQFAIADTTLNRVVNKRWPNTVAGVVTQHKQFSWVEAAGINEELDLIEYQANLLANINSIDLKAYKQAEWVAKVVLEKGYKTTYKFNHYHTVAVSPKWSIDQAANATKIGYHLFYKM